MSLPDLRSTRDVIDEAIDDNRFGEYLLYGISILFVVGGFGVVVAGLVKGREITGIVGLVATALFYPAMRLAKTMRQQNMAIRLLEIPLNNSKTAEEAAAILQQFFQSTFKEGAEETKKVAASRSKSKPTP